MGANAQTSVPAFTAGQVLTAAQMTQVNTGIPVFASSTERDAAFGGAGEKTLAEGQMAYLEDTNETQYYDGSSWAVVGGGGGLVFISRTTIGSAVSSVAVSGAFSTDYDNYKVIVNLESASANSHFNVTVGSANTGYYRSKTSGMTYTASGGTMTAFGASNASSWTTFLTYDTQGQGAVLELQAPFLALETKIQALLADTGDGVFLLGGYLNDTTSHTSITFTAASGTVTGGTIDVYGYAKA